MTGRFNFIILDGNVIQNGGEKFLLGKVCGREGGREVLAL